MNFHALVHCLIDIIGDAVGLKYINILKKTRTITIHTLHTSFSRSTPYNPEDKTERLIYKDKILIAF